MDPINYSQKNNVYIIDGAQDAFFPVRSFKRTRDRFQANAAPGVKVFGWLVPDMDHKWYSTIPLVQLNPCPESYFNTRYSNPIDWDGYVQRGWKAFFTKAVNNDLADFGDTTPSISISVTGSLIKTYTTTAMIDTSNRLQDVRIGYSGTNFFHVFPGLNQDDSVNVDDIPSMTQSGSCLPGHTCWTYSNSYTIWGQPPYYGAYAQAHYTQPNYGNDPDMDLEWYVTGDVASAGTGGYTAMTFIPDIRCNEYTDPWPWPPAPPDCSCKLSVPATDEIEGALLGEE